MAPIELIWLIEPSEPIELIEHICLAVAQIVNVCLAGPQIELIGPIKPVEVIDLMYSADVQIQASLNV